MFVLVVCAGLGSVGAGAATAAVTGTGAATSARAGAATSAGAGAGAATSARADAGVGSAETSRGRTVNTHRLIAYMC